MSYNLYIFLLLLITIYVDIFGHIENFEEKKHYDVIISINVHEKFDFLKKQLDNIRDNVKCNYAVILNCNEFMFNECKNNNDILPENVYIHPVILEKRTYHGSLVNGIYNNMMYALDNFTFEFFISTSSRNLFDNDMELSDLHKLVKMGKTHIEYGKVFEEIENNKKWHWPSIEKTLLAKHLIETNQKFYVSPHEGLMLSIKGCRKIVEFLENKPEIKKDLFQFETCVEEFALQTISMNMGEPIYYIGNGCCSEAPIDKSNSDTLFMYKTRREMMQNPNTFVKCAVRA